MNKSIHCVCSINQHGMLLNTSQKNATILLSGSYYSCGDDNDSNNAMSPFVLNTIKSSIGDSHERILCIDSVSRDRKLYAYIIKCKQLIVSYSLSSY